MYRDFVLQGVSEEWFVPIIQGFVDMRVSRLNGIEILFMLISRRSWQRAGTRFHARGLDDDGNVANFVETEQCIRIHDKWYSYVQIRGSVPVFWSQSSVIAGVELTRSKEVNSVAFMKHIDDLIQRYKHVTFVNLLSNSKSHEKLLTNAIECMIYLHKTKYENLLAYSFFDFHAVCKGQKYYKVSMLLSQIQNLLNYYMYYSERRDCPETFQKGVVRTNCLDCLDRTNVAQSRIAWYSLLMQFRSSGISIDFNIDENGSSNPFIQNFNELWAENADILSKQYTGTGSTISSVTRQGNSGLKVWIDQNVKSLGRFYQANIEDSTRQKAFELLLNTKSKAIMTSKAAEMMKRREEDYTNRMNYSLRIITWNIAGRKPPCHLDLSELIIGGQPADIVFGCFQEVVKLNAMNVIQESKNANAINWWRAKIADELSRVTKTRYVMIKEEDLVGCYIVGFAKESVYTGIKNVESDKIKTGFKGKMGNKGSVMVRFDLFDTSVCIWNCHLASGNDQLQARLNQLSDIHSKGFQKEGIGRSARYNIGNHDVKILAGDLNFRIQMSNWEIRSLIQSQQLENLLRYDQLLLAKHHGNPILSSYKECPITFLPTYKYDDDSQIYDTSKKQRTPAWCDRVLYAGDNLIPHIYNRCEYTYSDHRAVYATFSILAKQIDRARYELIEQEVYQELYSECKQTEAPKIMRPVETTTAQEINLLDL